MGTFVTYAGWSGGHYGFTAEVFTDAEPATPSGYNAPSWSDWLVPGTWVDVED